MSARQKLSLIFILLIIYGCGDLENPNITNPIEPGDGDGVLLSYAPWNISGKSLIIYKSNGAEMLQVPSHNYDGTCNVSTIFYGYQLWSTPSYTYSRTSNNSADYSLNYRLVMTIVSHRPKYDKSYSVTLRFTNSNSGTFSGTTKFGYYPNESITGTFELN